MRNLRPRSVAPRRSLLHAFRRPRARRSHLGTLALLAIAGAAVQELAARAYYRRTPAPEARFTPDERTAWTPAWREVTSLAEWARATLRAREPVDDPRGDGAPVVLIPGFLMSGAYLRPMQRWLQSLGYDARIADIGINADCFDVVANQVLRDVDAARRHTGRRVHLIGHSLGGALARAAAGREPEAIASIALLGAPVRGLRLHPGLRLAAAIVRRDIHRRREVPEACATFACPCDTVRALAAEPPSRVPMLSVATEDDGVADWRYSVDPLAARALAVRGSHLGLVFNRAVYEAVADHLAAAASRAAA